jgi:hypothetical protein
MVAWTWSVLSDGLRTRAVAALAIDAAGEHLYAGTEGEGVFRLDLTGSPPPSASPAPGDNQPATATATASATTVAAAPSEDSGDSPSWLLAVGAAVLLTGAAVGIRKARGSRR